ncbi:MAG: homocysteine biosynthesis protein [Desulfobacterales bacterium]|nr:MAG: homocysteine biosynthesis protein [Desulfobacterales bacterium]UCD89398.1 MAG: homocysteine biosynthesis protein [Desulfobacterales bacterium]
MTKTIEEINAKIRSGTAVVLTAEEIIDVVQEKGSKKTAREVDVVTTGTFAPMCSSGAFFNIKQPKDKMKLGGGFATLNDVPAYAGLAAADIYIGATALPDGDPRNSNSRPGKFRYGGAHVIEDLVAGKKVTLKGGAYGTDCYPRKSREQLIGLDDMNDAFMFNPRNCYQNYNVAVNLSDKPIYTYMGKLKPKLGNAYYCSAGQLSPLFNDPHYRTIGIGTRIFFCGAEGYVVWPGTQHNPGAARMENDTPLTPAGTIALIGDLRNMSLKWLRAVSFAGYGLTLSVAIGVPIPILDEEIVRSVSVTDNELKAPVVDYSEFYPRGEGAAKIGEVTYEELKSGSIRIKDQDVPTGSFSSYAKAREVAQHLKQLIQNGDFYLTQWQAPLPGANTGKEATI